MDGFNIPFSSMDMNQGGLGGFGASPFGGFGGGGFPPFGFGAPTKSRRVNGEVILPREGSKVKIQNVKSSPALNGQTGTVAGHNNHRCVITLDNSGAQVALKFENLLQILPVTISSLRNRTDLNNTKAQITGITKDGRIEVLVGGSSIALKRENVILPRGSVVRMEGLQQTAELNGAHGLVKGFDRSKGRYQVGMRNDKEIFVKPANVCF